MNRMTKFKKDPVSDKTVMYNYLVFDGGRFRASGQPYMKMSRAGSVKSIRSTTSLRSEGKSARHENSAMERSLARSGSKKSVISAQSTRPRKLDTASGEIAGGRRFELGMAKKIGIFQYPSNSSRISGTSQKKSERGSQERTAPPETHSSSRPRLKNRANSNSVHAPRNKLDLSYDEKRAKRSGTSSHSVADDRMGTRANSTTIDERYQAQMRGRGDSIERDYRYLSRNLKPPSIPRNTTTGIRGILPLTPTIPHAQTSGRQLLKQKPADTRPFRRGRLPSVNRS